MNFPGTAISILEAEGLISMKRGMHGGAIVNRADWRMAARYVEFILEADKLPVTDLFLIRALIEPYAATILAARGEPLLGSVNLEEGC